MIRSGRIKPKKSDPALNRLKKLCRYYVVVLRDKNTCQRCGADSGRSQIHWAHVMTRNAKSLVCVPWNSLALCAGCHIWFDGNKGSRLNPSDGLLWWREKWPNRSLTLDIWSNARRHQKRNLYVEIAWFEREIALAGGFISDAVKPRKKSEGA